MEYVTAVLLPAYLVQSIVYRSIHTNMAAVRNTCTEYLLKNFKTHYKMGVQ